MNGAAGRPRSRSREDLVLVTTGSQAADLSAGSMTEAPRPRPRGRSWALWARLAKGRTEFGKPDAFFGEARVPLSRWVTFTVTDTKTEFIDQIAALTDSESGRGGLVTLKDSGRVLSLSISTSRKSSANRPAPASRGAMALSRTHRRFRAQTHGSMHRRGDPGRDAAAAAVRPAIGRDHRIIDFVSSTCLRQQYLAPLEPRRQASRGSRGGDDLGLIGQYVEVPKEIAFTIECSVRSAWEAIYVLLKRGPAPPPVIRVSTIRRRCSAH